MAKLSIKAGTTSKTCNVFVQDSSKTTGVGLAGLTNNSSGLLAHYIREGESSSNPITVTSAAIGTWTSGGFIEIEASAMPGLYQIGLPNAVCSANAKSATVYYFGATNMAPSVLELELTGVDNQDSVHFGLTCLPNTAVTTNGSLLTAGTGTAQVSTSAGQVLVQRGSAAGQIDAISGVVNATVITNSDKTGYSLAAAYDFAKGTVAMTESYAALHVAPTPVQLLFETRALLAENTVGTVTASAATVTTKKIDGSTTAETFTLTIDGSSSPTAITRAS